VAPTIGVAYSNDANRDRIDDRLAGKGLQALAAQKSALTLAQQTTTQADLAAMVEVELVFQARITQRQIDDFLAAGGQITYLYKAVSYGWNGYLPLGKVAAMPALMGASLTLIQEAVPMQWHLDVATRTGRVRPIWASGFAGVAAGLDGDSTITIGIVDTGVDETHPDLAGRRVYWHDFSSDALGSPADVVQHGSHVAGIALGSGAGIKVFNNTGSGSSSAIGAGVDDLVANRVDYNIKVMNLSLGTAGSPGINTSQRQKINTAVQNGIVVVVSAGNDGGTQEVDDPGRAALALTVGAANDVNQLTDYTSAGFAAPGATAGQEEDYKPDLMAPGGSVNYYGAILSVDSNSGDGTGFADQQAGDYYNVQGTSMASPFAAGCAARVVDALQQSGLVWDFNSSVHARRVKMLLCATASESNTNREGGTNNPTLQRAVAGPSGFPIGKDPYEGYGMINPDAAVEAVRLTCSPGGTNTAALGPAATDRRAWARTIQLVAGQKLVVGVAVVAGGDFDAYLYRVIPTAYGTPILLASSTQAGSGVGETLSYTSSATTNALLVVKRVSGSGTFSLVANLPPTVQFAAAPERGAAPLVSYFTNLSSSAAYSWDFGDGDTSSAANPVKIYTNAGVFTVRLTAANPAGTNFLVRPNYIVVTNPPPPPVIADFVVDATNGVAPLRVNFTNRSSGGSEFAWDFGDGNTSASANPANLYTNAGQYSVTNSVLAAAQRWFRVNVQDH
jgi:hypothetical protein